MSKSQNPMTGHMSGSMANFATYKRFGENIIRSKAFEPKDANTDSQKAQRASFKLIVKAYESFGGATDIAFPKRAENQSPFNAFVAANLPEAIDKSGSTPVIDYSKLLISNGTLLKTVATATIGATGITMAYKKNVDPRITDDDEVVALAKLKSGELLLEKKVCGKTAGSVLLPYEDITADDVECCYLFVQKADGSNVSDSTYVKIV